MATFLTGATGYIGSYLAAGLAARHGERLNLLVRAADTREAEQRLWRALQQAAGPQPHHFRQPAQWHQRIPEMREHGLAL